MSIIIKSILLLIVSVLGESKFKNENYMTYFLGMRSYYISRLSENYQAKSDEEVGNIEKAKIKYFPYSEDAKISSKSFLILTNPEVLSMDCSDYECEVLIDINKTFETEINDKKSFMISKDDTRFTYCYYPSKVLVEAVEKKLDSLSKQNLHRITDFMDISDDSITDPKYRQNVTFFYLISAKPREEMTANIYKDIHLNFYNHLFKIPEYHLIGCREKKYDEQNSIFGCYFGSFSAPVEPYDATIYDSKSITLKHTDKIITRDLWYLNSALALKSPLWSLLVALVFTLCLRAN